MKNRQFLLSLFLINLLTYSPYLNAQGKNNLDGTWIKSGENGPSIFFKLDESTSILNVFQISGDSISMLTLFKEGNSFSNGTLLNYWKNKEYSFKKSSVQNKNNAVYLYVNTCRECEWTETQIFNFSLVAEHKLVVHWQRILNNKDSENSGGIDCFAENGKCGTMTRVFHYERYIE